MKKFRSILVTTDFSAASRPACRRAVGLAAESGARLWIAHALPSIPWNGAPRMYEEMEASIRSDAEKRLSALTRAARAAGARAEPLLLRDPAHEAIRKAARAHRADLVVVGTHGRTGLARIFVGSIAARVLATAPCPVLSVRRGGGKSSVRRLLFATDFSEASAPAWKEALALARANRARLRIVHVETPLALGQGARWAYAEAEAEGRADSRRRLQALVASARQAGVRAESRLARGSAHEAIVREARSMKDAWIVVGTHGRTGLSGALLGSVAARVVATAPCPVLTVRSAKRS